MYSSRAVATFSAEGGPAWALQDDGQVLCWGDNEFDVVGPGVGLDTVTPTAIVW